MSSRSYEDWIVVLKTGTDYEADLVRDRLDDADIPAVVLTQRDHAFNLNVGDLAEVNVLVPPDRAEDAIALLQSEPFTDEELEQAALAAGKTPDKHTRSVEAMLDSGLEEIRFTMDDGDDEETEESD
jgi:hypothetical protein